ncbi:hypothetical protein [Kordiimonas aestuarii]|uniref:hypothetical protein n=1 Tax=Kordiimonas aestuarii TaxID=1005925 RepID=UPI0021D0C9F6|nr:hypothetical protein [Kordiimonas aestuarii]
MSLSMIIAGIQAVLRAGQAGVNLYAEHARDRAIFLPDLSWPASSTGETVVAYFRAHPDVIKADPVLKNYWKETPVPRISPISPSIIDQCSALMLKNQAQEKLVADGKDAVDAQREAEMLAGGRMVEQWRESRKPPSAWARMALTITDVGLEFVGTNPSLFGIGGKGETLVTSFAKQMNELIPNDVGDMGPRDGFTDRVLGIFLRAGLGTLEANTSLVIKNENIAKLVAGVTKPIIDAMPTSITDQMVYRDLVDALAGPAAEAAFKILAENTSDYLGKDFANDTALGAVTTALFSELQSTAADGNVLDQFKKEGLIQLYQSGLKVAVDNPSLFISGDSPKNELFRDLLKGTATVLSQNPTFKGQVGTALAAMAIEVVGSNAPKLLKLNPDEPWEKVAEKALEQVTGSLSAAITSGNSGALGIFNEKELLDLGRILLQQAAQTPGMLGIDKPELQDIASGIAKAMAADTHLLLTSDGWLKIAAAAVEEASANPGRLFGTDANSLATTAIKSILTVAGEAWSDGGRAGSPRLFGNTLRDAIIEVVHGLGGNVSAAAGNPDLVKNFIKDINDRTQADPQTFGADTVKKLIRLLLGKVLATGTLPTDSDISAALAAS